MSVLASLLPRERRAVRDEDLWGAWVRGEDISPRQYAPVRVTRESAQALAAVWACRNLIAGTIASLPWDVMIRREGVRRPFRPRPEWVTAPNREQTRVSFVEQVVESLLLDGTAFVATPRDGDGRVTEVWCVHPSRVWPRREGSSVVYDVVGEDGTQVRLAGGLGGQMFHIPAYAPPGALRGMAPLEVARTLIGAGLAAQEFSARFFGQGMSAGGLIEIPAGQSLSKEEREALREDFERLAHGLRRSHLPAVLTGGATWKPLQITPEQAQFIETRKFTKADVATFFGVPPHLIGDVERSTSWGTGIEEQTIAFVTYTLRQWIVRIEDAFTRYLLYDLPGTFIRFNVEGLLRGQQEARYRAYATGRQWGWLSVDEIRQLEDLPPVGGDIGNAYLRPLNMEAVASDRSQGG